MKVQRCEVKEKVMFTSKALFLSLEKNKNLNIYNMPLSTGIDFCHKL